jgi:DNA-binding PadR family transcriptional regulator
VDLPTTFAAASPKSDTDGELVGAYWLQISKGQADVDAQEVNRELKQLGHGVGNITRAFDHLMAAKPQLVIQTRKSGKVKQARKKYRVTEEGIARVNQLIAASRRESQRK